MANKNISTGSDFLASFDIGKTFASAKEESTLKLSDLFKVFNSRSDSIEEPKKESQNTPKEWALADFGPIVVPARPRKNDSW